MTAEILNSNIEYLRPAFDLSGNINLQKGYLYDPSEVPDNFQKSFQSVGILFTLGKPLGTCFIARYGDKKFLISAKHCFYNEQEPLPITARFPDGFGTELGEEKRVFLPKPLSHLDIILFEVERSIPVPGLELAIEPFQEQENQPVVVMGFAGRYILRHNKPSLVASVGVQMDFMDRNRVLVSDARVEPGSSGAPILDVDSKVISVVRGINWTYIKKVSYSFNGSYVNDATPRSIALDRPSGNRKWEDTFHHIIVNESTLLSTLCQEGVFS